MKILVTIDVPELGPAIDFYRALLDLNINRIIDEDVAELTGASSVLYLLHKTAGLSPAKDFAGVRQYARHWTPVHLDFVVDDVQETAKRAIRAGARQESDCIEWMGSKCISVSDPSGHGFCLIEFTGETYSGAA